MKWEIEDITNAPFLIQSYGSCEGIEHARYVIIFPQGQLRNIESSKESLNTSDRFASENLKIYPFPSFSYTKEQVFWEIGGKAIEKNGKIITKKIDKNVKYRVDWKWYRHQHTRVIAESNTSNLPM